MHITVMYLFVQRQKFDPDSLQFLLVRFRATERSLFILRRCRLRRGRQGRPYGGILPGNSGFPPPWGIRDYGSGRLGDHCRFLPFQLHFPINFQIHPNQLAGLNTMSNPDLSHIKQANQNIPQGPDIPVLNHII
eukprot:sb/3474821/